MDASRNAPVFEEFYEEYYNTVFGYICKKIGRTEDAQDLTQDIFSICFRKFDEYDPEKSAIGTWLFVIVNNKLKNYYRDRKQIVSLDESISEPAADENEDDMLRALTLESLRSVLADALEALPERSRKIVILRYFGEKSSDEIASELSMSAVNVRVVLSRSLKLIREHLSANGWNGTEL